MGPNQVEQSHKIRLELNVDLIKNALANRLFPQLPFMSESRFESFLRDRGFQVGIPGVNSLVDCGVIERLDTESGEFHPFQVWPISRLLWSLEIRLDTGINLCGLDHARLEDFFRQNWSRRKDDLTNFPKGSPFNEFNRKIFPLLLWLESYFLPVVRGPRPGIVRVAGFDAAEWPRWDARSQGPSLLDEHSVSIEDLSQWRDKVLFDAFSSDPAADLYLLLRSMPFDQRDRFKGRLRLAYDLYEIAEVIRLFLEQVSDKPLVKEWHPNGHPDTPWVERVYGSQPQFGSPGFLRPVVRHFGLDPAFRLRWLVEGGTEEGFIRRYTKRLGANIGEFVTIRNFGGDGSFQRQIPAIDADLHAAMDEHCFVTLTFDDDSTNTRSRLEGLVQNGLVNVPFVLNKPDFELQNFNVGQLVSVATTWASDLSKPIRLDEETLAECVSQRISEKNEGFQKALNTVLYLKGEKQFKLSKGEEWGKRLADCLLEMRDSEWESGTYSEDALTKIERQVLFMMRNSEPFIDYPGSIRNLDPASLEIS